MLPSDEAPLPCKSAAIQDSFGHKGAFFLGTHHCTESLLSVINISTFYCQRGSGSKADKPKEKNKKKREMSEEEERKLVMQKYMLELEYRKMQLEQQQKADNDDSGMQQMYKKLLNKYTNNFN